MNTNEIKQTLNIIDKGTTSLIKRILNYPTNGTEGSK